MWTDSFRNTYSTLRPIANAMVILHRSDLIVPSRLWYLSIWSCVPLSRSVYISDPIALIPRRLYISAALCLSLP